MKLTILAIVTNNNLLSAGCSLSDNDESLLTPQAPDNKKQKSSLNGKNVALFVCLWVAYFLCSMAYSIIGPFFPQEVL